MKTIGVRDAKGRLSQLLRDVRQGQEWVITERGVPIAKLVPVGDAPVSTAERLRQYEAAGLIEPAPRDPRPLPPPLPGEPGLAQRWLQSDRDS